MLLMYFTGDYSKAIPQLKDQTMHQRVLCGTTSPCFAFKELLKELLAPVLCDNEGQVSSIFFP